MQLAVLQVRAEALGRLRERAKLATRDSLEWDRLHACAKARRKMEPRKEVLVRLLVQRLQQPPLGFVATFAEGRQQAGSPWLIRFVELFQFGRDDGRARRRDRGPGRSSRSAG